MYRIGFFTICDPLEKDCVVLYSMIYLKVLTLYKHSNCKEDKSWAKYMQILHYTMVPIGLQ